MVKFANFCENVCKAFEGDIEQEEHEYSTWKHDPQDQLRIADFVPQFND